MSDLTNRLRAYAAARRGELADLITEAADALANAERDSQRVESVEMRWIPCAERLPEGNGKIEVFGLEYSDTVLVSGGCYEGEQIHGTGAYLYDHKTPELSGWVGAFCDGSDLEFSDVMAWMPLPEPWKEEE